MAVNLGKGGNVSLSKEEPGLKKILVGLGWDVRTTDGVEFDLDASLFMVANTGKVRSDNDFIFYNNLKSSDGSVEHTGDNRTGAGEGDDEVIKIDLQKVPADVTKYSSKQISEQNHAAIFKCSGALAITFATDFVDQLNGCA